MKSELINDQGELVVKASHTSSPRDFDFLIGDWSIHNRKLKSRLTGCTEWSEFDFTSSTQSILNGFGNLDESGSTMRLYSPSSTLWTIYGAFAGATTLDVLVGSFEGNLGKFFGHDVHDGQPVICHFLWDKTDPLAPIWSQAFSTDHGLTWEWNWTMTFTCQN